MMEATPSYPPCRPGYPLANITHLIIDMDGVLYLGDQPMRCLCEFFAFLRERPIPFILATNNSTRTPRNTSTNWQGWE